jgi:hypothetical protein
MAFAKLAGKMEGGVAYGRNGGTAIRATPTYRYPVTPPVAQGNARLKRANAVWNTLTEAQADAWNAYGEAHPRRDAMTGERYAPAGKNLFVGLAAKLLQLDPEATLPLLPPTKPFLGDGVTVALGSNLDDLGNRISAENGAIVFAASGPNAPGVATELMIQPLKNVRCKPVKFYKSHGFVSFAAPDPTAAVPVGPGVYACAIQFVERSTGLVAGWLPLGKITVE